MAGHDAHRVAVAYSGGRDSTALLHAVLHAVLQSATRLPVQVWALHVHHGLSRHADAWQQHCQWQCARWTEQGLPVALVVHRVPGRPPRGDSVEAWARQVRYAALRQMANAEGISLVLLAQHRRDQAETFLLQALRGAGVAGQAGMARAWQRDGITWMRPWLALPREAIDGYVQHHALLHVEDDSNDDTRFARNRLRRQVWPALTQAFAQAEAALAAAATWAQQASACLDELAGHDLAPLASERGLAVTAWSALSPPRRSNALRAWLADQTGQAAPATLVLRLQDELPRPGAACWPCAGGELRRHRGLLRFVPATGAAALASLVPPESGLSIRRAGRYRLPGWRGSLVVARTQDGGVPLAWLAHLQLAARCGGERFQSGIGRPPRSLKKQFQAAGLAAWERDGPLLYSGGQLVFVPGLGLDARMLALPGQPQVSIRWVGDSP